MQLTEKYDDPEALREDRHRRAGGLTTHFAEAGVLSVTDNHYYLDDALLEQGFEHENGCVVATKTALQVIEVRDGRIVAVLAKGAALNAGLPRYSARGALMLPAFHDMHVHLDKTFYGGPWRAPLPRRGATIFDMIAREAALLPELLRTSRERAEAVIDLLLSQGTTRARCHCNIDPISGLKSLEHLKLALENRSESLSCDIVAFPQHGLLRSGVEGLMREAAGMGVDFIGGLDPTVVDGAMEKSLDTMFQIALDHDKAVDIHLHEMAPTGVDAIRYMIETIERTPQLKNRLSLSHAVALATLSPEELEELASRMAAQGVTVVSAIPIWAPAMPLPQLRGFGVKLMSGTDSVMDHWSAFGTGDMLEKANLWARLYRNGDEFGLSRAMAIASGDILPLADDGSRAWPSPGDPAEFVLVAGSCSAEAVARRSPRLATFHKGRLVFGTVDKG
ncbi:cytosine/adenosine deaminase-related metal-dependent hydrolase [Aminobacter lissarensis]|uniref:Cytosine/adenosine deaminase-related metal-dependent hydrolase n=1 Tax=Aminobacter carboxidus TaxID=376165 RepID=A0A8E2BEA4_9HYPH|nr:amidohydrolase family protein [Aminobacter lissarensis]MBB6469551.1 cytosine/adenosine deaminase-related metal-dependent hydrolase [Aminobacter lissarensis]